MPTVQTTIAISIQLTTQFGIPARSKIFNWPSIRCESSHDIDFTGTCNSMDRPHPPRLCNSRPGGHYLTL